MNSILLSITIPTYNRVRLLTQTLNQLLPQLNPAVEVVICDNHSTDATPAYLATLNPQIRYVRQPMNIGPDGNVLSCLREAKGEYVWLLCDDDLPCSNAVPEILKVIRSGTKPGLISLRATGCDIRMSNFDPALVKTGWDLLDRDAFLNATGEMLTFASITIPKTNVIDFKFLESHFGTFLVPAALALQTAGTSNCIMMSQKPLLFARGGNAGGYDAYTVFSRNLIQLLKQGRKFGYKSDSLAAVYKSALKSVHKYIIEVWPKTAKGLWNLFIYSITYKEFYKYTLPTFFKPIRKSMKRILISIPGGLIFSIMRRYLKVNRARVYPKIVEIINGMAQAAFEQSMPHIGPKSVVNHPFILLNPQCISIGSSFHSGAGLRLEAFCEWEGQHFSPQISIGNNVSMNQNVHIGGVNKIKIGDNTTIGSHVLITDHSHGSLSADDLGVPPMKRRLLSKGPVIIEDDVWIGEGVCILPNVRIGKGAVIGANAVVTSDVQPYTVVGGIPARLIKRLA